MILWHSRCYSATVMPLCKSCCLPVSCYIANVIVLATIMQLCHCHQSLLLSCYVATLMLLSRSQTALPLSCSFVTVVLLCHCCTALLVMLYTIIMLLCHCHAAWHCHNTCTLWLSYCLATIMPFFHWQVMLCYPLSYSCGTHAALSLAYCLGSPCCLPVRSVQYGLLAYRLSV